MTNQYEPFDLERALAGEPVVLKDGKKAESYLSSLKDEMYISCVNRFNKYK